MRRDRSSGSFRKDGREKATSIPRALSWLGLSTLSRQTRRIFHSQGELVIGQQGQDDDDWIYRPQHRKGLSGSSCDLRVCSVTGGSCAAPCSNEAAQLRPW
ncbi:hypothetical protein COCON_G00093750 [Conger conger]|uniref:Uncharacterized protein n=1 Tax=Conger conger TaxID=82655 RepID=A0A9Q1DLI6_CONCO|nr:hypothetical protein COCON_G00093750 [Conger conger]